MVGRVWAPGHAGLVCDHCSILRRPWWPPSTSAKSRASLVFGHAVPFSDFNAAASNPLYDYEYVNPDAERFSPRPSIHSSTMTTATALAFTARGLGTVHTRPRAYKAHTAPADVITARPTLTHCTRSCMPVGMHTARTAYVRMVSTWLPAGTMLGPYRGGLGGCLLGCRGVAEIPLGAHNDCLQYDCYGSKATISKSIQLVCRTSTGALAPTWECRHMYCWSSMSAAAGATVCSVAKCTGQASEISVQA